MAPASQRYFKKGDAFENPVSCLSEFKILEDFLERSQVPILKRSPDFLRTATLFDKVFFRADRPCFYVLNSKQPLDYQDVYHVAIHHLVSLRYGGARLHRPHTVLLGEALASCAEIYFCFEVMNASGMKDPSVQRTFARVREQAKHFLPKKAIYRQYLKSTFNQGFENSFQTFREIFKEMFDAYIFLWNSAKNQRALDHSSYEKLHKKLKSYKYAPFVCGYDIPNNILYVLTHCGLVSNKMDRESVKDCISLLDKAVSFEDFVSKLSGKF